MASEEQQHAAIRATLALSQDEARTGTRRTLTFPGGQQVQVTIPPQVYSGQEIYLPGPPDHGSSRPLIITVAIASQENAGPQPFPEYGTMNFPTTISTPPPPSGMSSVSQPGYPPNTYYSAQPPFSGASYPPPYPPANPAFYGQPGTLAGSPAPGKKRPVALLVTLGVLALIIIIASMASYAIYIPIHQQADATATAIARATQTAQANQQATAQAYASATAEVQATAAIQAQHWADFKQASQGTPAIDDTLAQPDNNSWDEDTYCRFSNNAYHVQQLQKGYFAYCTTQANRFADFAIQVQMNLLRGEAGGFIFRANTVDSKYYVLLVNSTGFCYLYYYPNSHGQEAQEIASGTDSSIPSGVNHPMNIQLLAQGSQFNFYVNNTFIFTISDANLTTGTVGFIASAKNTATEVTYTHVKIWKL